MVTVERIRSVAAHQAAVERKKESMRDDISIETRENLFDDNDKCLIDNPFARLQPDGIKRTVKKFVNEFGLENHQDVFLKAGKLVQDPEIWNSVVGLDKEEKEALKHETSNGFWKQPKELKVVISTLCVAAVVQGWNQTAANGANLNWPNDLGPKLTGCDPQGSGAWIFAIVNASTYLSASLVGCWISDPLNEYFYGRRPAICISAILILGAMIGSACVQTWQQLLACRCILGIGMGCKASVVPVFAAEVSPAHIRGTLVMNWQLFDAFGTFLGFTSNLIVSQVPSPWRWQMASSCLPTIVLLTLIFVCSESPRFLIKRGPHRYPEAFKLLTALRGSQILAAKELLFVHYQMEIERRHFSGIMPDPEALGAMSHDEDTDGKGKLRSRLTFRSTQRSINYWQKLGQLFTQKRIRRATISAVVCMVSQQLCGVNVLEGFSSTLYCDANDPHMTNPANENFIQPLFLSWGIGLTNFLFAFPTYWLIEKKGRRWLLLVALPFMALSMLGAGLSFKISPKTHAHSPIIGLFTYIFMVFYSFSMGPVPFTLSAEVFPLEHRVVGMSFAVFTNMFGLGLIILFVPALTNVLHHSGLLGVFAALNVVSFILVFFFVRETAGAALERTPGSLTFISLEELDYLFGVSTKRYAARQIEVLIWAWRYYILQDKSCSGPERFYSWTRGSSADAAQPDESQTAPMQVDESYESS